jgi:hypothetical protein
LEIYLKAFISNKKQNHYLVEMMRQKKIRYLGIMLILSLVFSFQPASYACDDQDDIGEHVIDCSAAESSIENITDSSNVFTLILERYPLLDQIIQMILDLLYNWISQLYTGSSLV